MGILRRWFGPKGEVVEDPADLKDRLFQAVAADHQREFAALCESNRDTIRRSYPMWLKPDPELFGQDPRRVDRYGRALFAIATYFSRKLADDSLLRQLRPAVEQVAFSDWNARLHESTELMSAGRFEDALALLHELRSKIGSYVGLEATRMESLVVGSIGDCLMQTMRGEDALARFEEATDLCEKAGDEEGVRVQLSNRIEALRWMDRHRDAAPWAEKLADRLDRVGKPAEASRFRSRARILAAGEPLLRVLCAVDERIYEEDEAPARGEGRVQFLFERNRLSLFRCEAAMEEGGQRVQRGSDGEALACFAAAKEADPFSPRPSYETGAVLMRLGRFDEAVRSFEETERLAPGWFLVRSERWLAAQLAAGRFEPGVPGILSLIEDQPPESASKLGLALADRFPDLPQAWLLGGEGLHRLGRRAEAKEVFRRGLSCAEEPDVRTRLLVSLASLTTPASRVELEEAAALNGHLVSGAIARLLLRSRDAEK